MNRYVADTHALVWHLQANPKLSPHAQTIFLDADKGAHQIFVPSIVLVELIYLSERKRIETALVARAFDLLKRTSINYRVVPLDTAIARTLLEVDTLLVPEMPDRVIVATAKHLRLPLITHDSSISESKIVPVVW